MTKQTKEPQVKVIFNHQFNDTFACLCVVMLWPLWPPFDEVIQFLVQPSLHQIQDTCDTISEIRLTSLQWL